RVSAAACALVRLPALRRMDLAPEVRAPRTKEPPMPARRAVALAFLVAIACLVPSCFKLDQDVVLKKDGSGTVVLKLSRNTAMADMLEGMQGGPAGQSLSAFMSGDFFSGEG